MAIFDYYIPKYDEDKDAIVKNLYNAYIDVVQQLEWMFAHLDDNNIQALSASKITTGDIDMTGEIKITGDKLTTIIDQYGMDTRFIKWFKNMCLNSSFELFDNATLEPTHWTGGVVTSTSNWHGTWSLKLTAEETCIQDTDELANPTWYASISKQTRVSFHKKGGAVRIYVLNATTDEPYTLTNETGNSGDYIEYPENDNWEPQSYSVTCVPSQDARIKVKFEVPAGEDDAYIDGVIIEPDYTRKRPSFYSDGPYSIGSPTGENALYQTPVKAYRDSNAALVTVDTDETLVCSKAITLTTKADVHINFSANLDVSGALTMTGKTYLTQNEETTLKLTAHGLETDDAIINDTRTSALTIVTKESVDLLSHAAIAGQTTGDTIKKYEYGSTETAEAGTTTTNITITGHGLTTSDYIINDTRGETRAISAVVDVNNITVAAITGQTTADEISTYVYLADDTAEDVAVARDYIPIADYAAGNGLFTYSDLIKSISSGVIDLEVKLTASANDADIAINQAVLSILTIPALSVVVEEEETGPENYTITELSSHTFDNTYGYAVSLVAIDETHLMLAYSTGALFGPGVVKTFSLDGSYNVTEEDSLTHDATKGDYNSLVQIDATKYFLAYTSSAEDGWAATFTLDANYDITKVDSYEYDSSFGYNNSICKINSTRFFLGYTGKDSDGYVRCLGCDANADNIQAFTTLEHFTSDVYHNSVVQLDDTHFVLAYSDSSNDGRIVTFSIDESYNVTEIHELEHDTAQCAYPSLVKIDDTHVILAYDGPNGDGFIKTFTIDGSYNISQTAVLEHDTSWGAYHSLCKIDDTHFMLAYCGGDNWKIGYIKTFSINGAYEITEIDSYEHDNKMRVSTASNQSIVQLDSTHYALAYQDSDSKGIIKIFEID